MSTDTTHTRRTTRIGHSGQPRASQRRARTGSTLLEQVAILTLLGVLATVSVRGVARLLNATLVHNAMSDVATLFALAREQAAATGVRTAVKLDEGFGRLVVHAGSDTIARYEMEQHGNVLLETTRDSMAYTPSGLGFGASNLRLILRKGASAETLTVSRLGRVRR